MILVWLMPQNLGTFAAGYCWLGSLMCVTRNDPTVPVSLLAGGQVGSAPIWAAAAICDAVLPGSTWL
jgi:hypothetical protein